jgi:hypothetical protein
MHVDMQQIYGIVIFTDVIKTGITGIITIVVIKVFGIYFVNNAP